MNDKQAAASGIGLFDLLFVVFLVLKLTNVIAWSWWWITAPLWVPLALVILILLVIIGIGVFKDNTYTRRK